MKKKIFYNSLFFLIIITFPLNLFKKFFISNPYVNYILSDYLLIKIYLQDLFIFLLFIIYCFNLIKTKNFKEKFNKLIKYLKNSKFIVFLFLILIFQQYFNQKPLVSFFYFFTLIKFCLLFLIFRDKKTIFFKKNTLKKKWFLTFNFIFFFLIFLSFYQFFKQKPLTKYYFLGETNIANNFNITKSEFWGNYKKLPYATTPHPNILASHVFILGFILINLNKFHWKKQKLLSWTYNLIIFFLIIILIYLTKSISVFLSLFILVFYKIIKKFFPINLLTILLIGFLICPLALLSLKSHNNSIIRRNNLQKQAVHLFYTQPIKGVGWGNFTAFEDKFYQSREILFFNQPVHNVFWLFLSENGILGLIILILLYRKLEKNKNLLNKLKKIIFIILPILCLDHHFYTMNSSLFALFLLIFFLKNNPLSLRAGKN